MVLDISIVIIYFVIINIIGLLYAGSKNLNEYFLGDRSVPWVLACFSIVATETSTLTFISIPGLAYMKGVGFIQIILGYIVGRILVALFLLPKYYEGKIDTVYGFIHKRFGSNARRIMSIIFHITRFLADSVRLFATAIPLALLIQQLFIADAVHPYIAGLQKLLPCSGGDPDFLLYTLSVGTAIILIGLTTFFYTFFGGIKSVILVDAVQLCIYIFCAGVAIFCIDRALDAPLSSLLCDLPSHYTQIFKVSFRDSHDFFNSYNLFTGLIGGMFLSFASHGTDYIIVQRVLSCRNLSSARKAMIASGFFVLFQFALFLFLGLAIKVLLGNMEFTKSDDIFPYVIIHYIPSGFRGLMLAGIFAAAMSTLSSSINALSSSTVIDIFAIDRKPFPEKKKMYISKIVSFIWTIVIIITSMLFLTNKDSLIEVCLKITSITYGSMLGIFVIGLSRVSIKVLAVLCGVVTSLALMFLLVLYTSIFWTWVVGIGFSVTCVTTYLCHKLIGHRAQ